MRIAVVKELPPDLKLPKGPRKGQDRYYKMALLNTLLHLRPHVCLEIGTWKGGSVNIFQRYFEQCRPDGILVTVDIKKYVSVSSKRVLQVDVYPHTLDILSLHKKIAESDLLLGWRKNADRSVEANTDILRRVLANIGRKWFDFAFVDGDHWNLLKDVEIVKRVVRPPRYALLDDTTTDVFPCSRVYRDEIKPRFNTYDFEDWRIFTGTSLIWKK